MKLVCVGHASSNLCCLIFAHLVNAGPQQACSVRYAEDQGRWIVASAQAQGSSVPLVALAMELDRAGQRGIAQDVMAQGRRCWEIAGRARVPGVRNVTVVFSTLSLGNPDHAALIAAMKQSSWRKRNAEEASNQRVVARVSANVMVHRLRVCPLNLARLVI